MPLPDQTPNQTPNQTPDATPALPAPILAPLAEIDAAALPRDRAGLDAEALAELERSIAADGLRQPIEIFPLAAPRDGRRYGLLSGYRRLLAFETLAGSDPRFAAIPAFLRPETSLAAALGAMVAENEIRADLSPFERGLVAVRARDAGAFASIEEAVGGLFPMASKQKRFRLRNLAVFAEEMNDQLAAPEKLSWRQAERIAAAVSRGFGELMRAALAESSLKDPDHQWDLLQPILAEAEENAVKPERADRPGRPRRLLRPRYALTIRRERTRDGWSLHFTGREATGPLIDLVLDEIERLYAPE